MLMLGLLATLTSCPVFADQGFWHIKARIIGINANPDYSGAQTIALQIAGSPGRCPIITIGAGRGNIPDNSFGTEAVKRIYSTALTALMDQQPVSIWIWDEKTCAGNTIIMGEVAPF